MESNPKRARSDVSYIRLCDSFGYTAEQLIYPIIKAEESVRVMFEHQRESLMNILCKKGTALCPETEPNFVEGNIFIQCEPFSKWNDTTLKTYRDDVNLKLQNFNIHSVSIDHVMEQSKLSQPIIPEFDARIYELESKYQQHLDSYQQSTKEDTVPADLQIIGTLLKDLKDIRVSIAVLSHNAIGKSFLLNLLLLLTSESYRPNRKIKLPKEITGNPTVETVKAEHFEDLPEAIKDFLHDITEDQRDFKNLLEPICHELSFTNEMEQRKVEISFREMSRYFTDHTRVSIQPYLLPEKGNSEAYHCTTNCVIHVRYGASFQAKVEYFSEEELQNQLFELFLLEREVGSDKEKTHRKSLKKRFAVLTKSKLEKEKLHNTLKLITSPKDIMLCEEVKKFAGTTELYIGNGVNPTNDRLALQADAVIVLSEYSFKIACTEVKDVLRKNCFIKKWMKNPQEYKLMLVSYPEKNQPFQLGINDIEHLKNINEEENKKRTEDLEELARQLSLDLSEGMKKNIFSTTILPVLHCSIHAIEGKPHEIIEKNKVFLENTGVNALFRELDELTLKRKSAIIEEIKHKLAEYENSQIDEESGKSQINEESGNNQIYKESQEQSAIDSASKSINFQIESDFLKKNEYLFKQLKNQHECLIEKTLNEQLKTTMEKVAESAKTNLLNITSTVTEKHFFNPLYSGRHSFFKIDLYSRLFGHLDEEIVMILHDLVVKLRDVLDEYKQNAIKLFTEELKIQKKLKTATVGNSLQCALNWYMGKTRSSFGEDFLQKKFKSLLTESMKKHILQPAYTRTTGSTRPTEGEVAAQIEQVLLDVQSSFKIYIYSCYNHRWPDNLARFMVRSSLPIASTPHPRCTFCGHLKCITCVYIESSNTFTSRAKKVYHINENFHCKTSNAIYLITCKRCHLQYVGQTTNPVKRRFVDHLSTINRKKDLSLPKHFNLPDHSLQDLSLMVIDKVKNSSDLPKREKYWIGELNTLEPNGLNIKN